MRMYFGDTPPPYVACYSERKGGGVRGTGGGLVGIQQGMRCATAVGVSFGGGGRSGDAASC